MKFFVVQSYRRDKGRESTIVYEADTAAEAFVELDRLAEQMKRTGVRSDSVELLVVDEERRVISEDGELTAVGLHGGRMPAVDWIQSASRSLERPAEDWKSPRWIFPQRPRLKAAVSRERLVGFPKVDGRLCLPL